MGGAFGFNMKMDLDLMFSDSVFYDGVNRTLRR